MTDKKSTTDLSSDLEDAVSTLNDVRDNLEPLEGQEIPGLEAKVTAVTEAVEALETAVNSALDEVE